MIKFIIPRKYRKLKPGNYEATIDKVIFHHDGTLSIRLDNVKIKKEETPK